MTSLYFPEGQILVLILICSCLSRVSIYLSLCFRADHNTITILRFLSDSVIILKSSTQGLTPK